MLSFIVEQETVWEKIARTNKPIVLYGMGNGADKILDWCEKHKVKISGVFASDEFVRYQSFRGFTVVKYQELKDRLGEELLVLIAFASELPEVLANFRRLAQEQECLAPHMPLFEEEELVSREWLFTHEKELQRVYDKLADDWSRRVFAATLNYKLSGKLEYLFACESNRKEDLETLFPFGEEEVYFDLGAYNGDTVREFLELSQHKFKRVVAVEPDRRNCRKLRQWLEELGEARIQVLEKGIWKEEGFLGFSDNGGRQSSFLLTAKKNVEVINIDRLQEILPEATPATYIKMDLEGCEKQALEGGKQLIGTQLPKLLIAAYHYDEDIYKLPLQLWQFAPDYKIYLRKHPYVPAWELNLFCCPENLK